MPRAIHSTRKGKIEKAFSNVEWPKFLERAARLKGAALKDYQALAREYGIEVSLMGVRTFRDGPFEAFLEKMNRKREMADAVATVHENGGSLNKANAKILSQKIFDDLLASPEEMSAKEKNSYSLAIARLRAGDQREEALEATIADKEARLQLLQFDAAKAALKHASALQTIASDKNLDTAGRLEAARKRLFGSAPAGIKSLKELDHRKDLA